MDDNSETINIPLLAIGRQNYTLDSEDVEYHTCNNGHHPLGLENSDSYKVVSGLDGGDFYHSSGSCEPSEMQPPFRIGPLRRQNYMSLVPSQWDSHHSFPQTVGEGSSVPVFDAEQNIGQFSESGFLSLSDETNQGVVQPDFELHCSGPFHQSNGSNSHWVSDGLNHMGAVSATGSNLQEDIQGDCRGFAELHSFGVREGDARFRMASYLNGSSLDGRHSGSSMTEMPDNDNLEFENTSSKCNGSGHRSLNMRTNRDWNCDITGGEVNLLSGALLSTQSSSSSGSEKIEAPFLNGESTVMDNLGENSSARRVQSNNGRHLKRKSSTAGITSAIPFHSHCSAGRESRSSRLSSRAVLDRTDVFNQHCAATDFSHTTNLASMTQAWENSQNSRSIMAGSENGHMSEFLRGNSETSSPLGAINEQCERSNQTRSLCPQLEQSFPIFHAPFSSDTGRAMPNSSRHHRRPRHIRSGEQLLESDIISISNSAAMHESENGSASMISHGTSHLLMGSWSSNPLLLNGNYHQTGTALAHRVPSLYEEGHMRTASLLGDSTMNTCFISQTGSGFVNRAFTSSSTRNINVLDQHSHAYHTGAGSLIRPGPTSRPRFSSTALTGHNMTNIATPTLAAGSGLMPAQAVSTYQGTSYSATRPSVFGNDILVSHIQNLLGMPFRGLRVLPGGGTNPNNRVLSEELVMLDPSIVFGSVDMVDQHRDMRLDVDNMSYEELLALEERIGNVCTGLSEEMVEKCLKRSKHVDLDVPASAVSEESEIKCCICQEEYALDDELGTLECSHSFHVPCIKEWLVHKNQCPICKAVASAKS